MTEIWSPPEASPPEVSPLALAFIGDAVWELHVRTRVLGRGVRNPKSLHRETTRYVNAGAQAYLADKLRSELTEPERDILRRGRNAKSAHIRKSAGVLAYRHSTGFEALLGFLYGHGQMDRLNTVCERAMELIDHRGDETLV